MTGKTKRKNGKTAKVRLSAATLTVISGVAAYQAVQAVAATATLPIIARLVRAIELTVNTTLDFGTLAMTAERAGQATLDPGLDRLFIDGAGGLSLAGGKPAAGRLLIKGAEFPVAISIDEPSVKLTNGTNSVARQQFQSRDRQGRHQDDLHPDREQL